MLKMLKEYDRENEHINEYYAESEEDIQKIPETAPIGSIVMILGDSGLVVKMKHSDGTWKIV